MYFVLFIHLFCPKLAAECYFTFYYYCILPRFEMECEFVTKLKFTVRTLQNESSIAGNNDDIHFNLISFNDEFDASLFVYNIQKPEPIRIDVPENSNIFTLPIPLQVQRKWTYFPAAHAMCCNTLRVYWYKFYEVAFSISLFQSNYIFSGMKNLK